MQHAPRKLAFPGSHRGLSELLATFLLPCPRFDFDSRIPVPSHFSSSDVVLLRQGEGSGVRYIRNPGSLGRWKNSG